MQVLTTKLLERSPQDELRRAFTLFDLQQSGRITAKDLVLIARQLQVGSLTRSAPATQPALISAVQSKAEEDP